jgi:type II secretory pathway component PulF
MFKTIETMYLKSLFGTRQRIEFYKSLSLLIKNGVKLHDALSDIYNIYSDNGQNPNNIQAIVAQECLLGISEGLRFSDTLAKWTGYQEHMLIAAGEETGKLIDGKDYQGAFNKAIDVVNAMGAVRGAIMKASLYPSVLFAEGVFLLNKVATDLVPKLAQSTNPETWNGPATLLRMIADTVTNYGLSTLLITLALFVVTIITLPYLRGSLRLFLERIPITPWAIYRTFHGSTFLLNVGVLQSSGIKLNDAMAKLGHRASPWLKERIDAILYGINIGNGLGQALYKAGYDFPDKKAVQFLRVISGKDGANEEIEQFGKDWMKDSVGQLEGVASSLLTGSLLAIGALMLIVIAGAAGMTDSMIQGMNR